MFLNLRIIYENTTCWSLYFVSYLHFVHHTITIYYRYSLIDGWNLLENAANVRENKYSCRNNNTTLYYYILIFYRIYLLVDFDNETTHSMYRDIYLDNNTLIHTYVTRSASCNMYIFYYNNIHNACFIILSLFFPNKETYVRSRLKLHGGVINF